MFQIEYDVARNFASGQIDDPVLVFIPYRWVFDFNVELNREIEISRLLDPTHNLTVNSTYHPRFE